jgi:hypothetical protein
MFMPSGIAAAAGGHVGRFRVRAAQGRSSGGFISNFPPGWTSVRASTGNYNVTHDGNAGAFAAVLDVQTNSSNFHPTLSMVVGSQTVNVRTNFTGGNTQSDANFWFVVVEPVILSAGNVFYIETNSAGTILNGPLPPGWTLVRTGLGQYFLGTTVDTDTRTSSNAFFFIGKRAQANGCSVTVIQSGATSFLIRTQNLDDNATADKAFYVGVVLGEPETIKGAEVSADSTPTFVGEFPDGWTVTDQGTGFSLVDPNIAGAPDMDPRAGNYLVWPTAIAQQSGGASMGTSFGTSYPPGRADTIIDQTQVSDGAPLYKDFYIMQLNMDGPV